MRIAYALPLSLLLASACALPRSSESVESRPRARAQDVKKAVRELQKRGRDRHT